MTFTIRQSIKYSEISLIKQTFQNKVSRDWRGFTVHELSWLEALSTKGVMGQNGFNMRSKEFHGIL